MPTVAALYRYPVKGLSAEALAEVPLAKGETMPFDRAFAVENGPSPFDTAHPTHLPKVNFLMLMRNESLAGLVTRFDDAMHRLTIDDRAGNRLAAGRLDTPEGRRAIESFFDVFAAGELRGPARVLAAPGHSFSDMNVKCVSLINLETVRAIGSRIGAEVHPLRFRANVYVDGLAAFAEFDWVGRHVAAGGATLTAIERINRCAATNVNPETAERDLAIPRALLESFGHDECGIYLTVEAPGRLRVGDRIEPVSAWV
jgi:uncharacterized protein YcbX